MGESYDFGIVTPNRVPGRIRVLLLIEVLVVMLLD